MGVPMSVPRCRYGHQKEEEMNRKRLPARINISRTSGGSDPDKPIRIWLEDEASGVQIVEFLLTLEDFAKALTAQGHIPCTAIWGNDLTLSLIGCKREVKTERIETTESQPGRKEIKRLLDAYEVDGWLGSAAEFENWHRHEQEDGRHFYTVNFCRYIREDGLPVELGKTCRASD